MEGAVQAGNNLNNYRTSSRLILIDVVDMQCL